ncbi:MAG: hypothetical protein AAF555_02365 [Verrucomicrobiota bacterium]
MSSSPPTNFLWEIHFRALFDRCVARYRGGNRDFLTYYTEEDQAFLRSIGYQPREFFDYVEDYCEDELPSPEAAVLIAAARRDYFRTVQKGLPSQRQMKAEELPARGAELAGIPWLPRIIQKAKNKLRGENDPNIMYSCGGDRQFLRAYDLHPADFLRAVWAYENEEEKLVDFVKTGPLED